MSELKHSGRKGMQWGVRRWQNPDGSLTPAGRAHYGYGPAKDDKDVATYKKPGEMTNQELRDNTERLRLQNAYRNEVKIDAEQSRGYVSKKLRMFADRTVDSVLTKSAEAIGAKFIKSVFEANKDNNSNNNNNRNNNNSGNSNNNNNNNRNNNNSGNSNNNNNNNRNNNGGNGANPRSSDPRSAFDMSQFSRIRYRENRQGSRYSIRVRGRRTGDNNR